MKTTFFLGIFSIAGFVIALAVHSSLRGDGNIVSGLTTIIKEDAMRQTFSIGKENSTLNEIELESIEAPITAVLAKYFRFSTDIILGIPGKLFRLFAFMPILFGVYNFYKGKKINELAVCYFVSFLVSISWFVLGKGYSYLHTTLNFVMWYFGFVQFCIFIIVKQIIDIQKSG